MTIIQPLLHIVLVIGRIKESLFFDYTAAQARPVKENTERRTAAVLNESSVFGISFFLTNLLSTKAKRTNTFDAFRMKIFRENFSSNDEKAFCA